MSSKDDAVALRSELAGRLSGQLFRLLQRAEVHESDALRQLAGLRRGAGRRFGSRDGAEATGVYGRLIGPDLQGRLVSLDGYARRRVIDDTFLACTLVGWSRVDVVRAPEHRGSFGADLKKLEKEEAAERAFTLLADSDRAGLDYHLRRAFGLLASEDLGVEIAPLIIHLGGWDAESEWVQRRWSEDFWLGRGMAGVNNGEDKETAE